MTEPPAASSPPTAQDRANARVRRKIAARFQPEYDACLLLAEQVFGPGWLSSHRHFLLDKDEEERARRTGERPVPAATVCTVCNDAGDQRHFVVGEDGRPREMASYEEGFGTGVTANAPRPG